MGSAVLATVCQKPCHVARFEQPTYLALLVATVLLENQNRLTDMSRLVICQRDGRMESVLDNRHFVRLKFGRDAGFWRSTN